MVSSFLRRLAVAAAVSSAALPAAAATVTLTLEGRYAREGHIDLRDVIDARPRYRVAASGFRMHYDGTPGLDFAAFSLDLGTRALRASADYVVKPGSDPTVFANGGSAVQLSAGQKAAIQSLYDVAYRGVAAHLGVKRYSAGFQLALWEIVYEDSGTYSLGTGRFRDLASRGNRTTAFRYANAMLARIPRDDTATDTYRLSFFEATPRDSQNLVAGFAAPHPFLAPVPLPAAGLLLAGGLGGLVALRRRRRTV